MPPGFDHQDGSQFVFYLFGQENIKYTFYNLAQRKLNSTEAICPAVGTDEEVLEILRSAWKWT